MLVLSRILYGMLFGVVLILVSELCLANQESKEFVDDKLMIPNELPTLYKYNDKYSLVGTYKHYDEAEIETDKVFVGLRARF